jgi:hypothetical protein
MAEASRLDNIEHVAHGAMLCAHFGDARPNADQFKLVVGCEAECDRIGSCHLEWVQPPWLVPRIDCALQLTGGRIRPARPCRRYRAGLSSRSHRR